jgi:hypothetical protein
MIRTLDYTIGLTNAGPDDEYDVTYSLEKVLEKRGFEVMVIQTRKTALSSFRLST